MSDPDAAKKAKAFDDVRAAVHQLAQREPDNETAVMISDWFSDAMLGFSLPTPEAGE